MKKRQKPPEGGADWMGTYGDMVTLLLCFFVLLYSMSTIDQRKWEIIVKSFNPNYDADSQIVTDHTIEEGEDEVSGAMEAQEPIEETFDDLFQALKQAVESAGLAEDVELTEGDGYTFITFKDVIFFAGDSPVLKEEGKAVLQAFSVAMGEADHAIQQIEVMGHTSQAYPDIPNEVHTDRVLSARRSAEVVSFLQQYSASLTPSKLVSLGFGQFRPVATFDTVEGRAKNRRVEILITKSEVVEKSLDEYYQEVYGIGAEADAADTGAAEADVADTGAAEASDTPAPEAEVQGQPVTE